MDSKNGNVNGCSGSVVLIILYILLAIILSGSFYH